MRAALAAHDEVLRAAIEAHGGVAAADMTVAVIGIRMFGTLLREFSDLAEQLLVALAAELRATRQFLQQH
jgi:hypothetical protein